MRDSQERGSLMQRHVIDCFGKGPLFACLTVAACISLSIGQARAADPNQIGEDGSQLRLRADGLSRVMAIDGPKAAGGTVDVAIVASASGDVDDALFTDTRDKLLASGQFDSVSIINAGLETPDASTLSMFDAVFVWSNFDFDDSVTLGDRLADYVDAGGGVVLAVFATTSDVQSRFLAGRWFSGGYDVIDDQMGNDAGPATLGTVHLPAHPLAAGVSQLDGGTASFRPSTTQLNGGTLVASWSDGSPLIAFRDDLAGPRVDLGLYPPSDDVSSLFWDTTTDGAAILSNALAFAAGVDPTDVELRLVQLVASSGVETTMDPDSLPGQICDADPLPSSFVVELWASDIGDLNTGITGLFVDLDFNPPDLQVTSLTNSATFSTLADGSFDNGAGTVTNFGGTNFSPQGIEPTWVKIGEVAFTASNEGPSDIISSLGVGGLGVFGRPPPGPGETRLGDTTYGCTVPVPTVSQWGTVVLTLLLATAGTLLFGRGRLRAA